MCSSKDIVQSLIQKPVKTIVIETIENSDSTYGRWLEKKKATMSLNKASVALANKNVRIIYSLLRNEEDFDANKVWDAA